MRNIFLALVFLLQGCSVWHYNTNGTLAERKKNDLGAGCKITYSLLVNGFDSHIAADNRRYYEGVTKEVLLDLGCVSSKAKILNENDLNIYIIYSGSGGASGAEILTGLSLGLIPSWTTREKMYTYEFTRGASKQIYTIDQVSYNHLLLLPVFWVNFLTDSETDRFRAALRNFINNS